MAGTYIEIADVENKLFKKTADAAPTTAQKYIDQANVEIEDMAIRKEVAIADIAIPIHSKLKEYAINYALRQFAADRVGVNNRQSEGDVYKDLFQRSQYLMNIFIQEITETTITQVNQNATNRANIMGRSRRR